MAGKLSMQSPQSIRGRMDGSPSSRSDDSFHQLSHDINCVIHEDEKENNSSSNLVSINNNSKKNQIDEPMSHSLSSNHDSNRESSKPKDLSSLKSEDIGECSKEDSSEKEEQKEESSVIPEEGSFYPGVISRNSNEKDSSIVSFNDSSRKSTPKSNIL